MNQKHPHANALIHETSPYLLQHAHNPVDWHPWGPAAFAKARRENKLIFLSVGYATCYWCHVMERQSFENPSIAALMNEHFINIKVDREERPDVDDLYMTAVQIMTGRGGWPMSVFLTPPRAHGENDPGLKPLYAGTYFPPEPTQGMPGLTQILRAIAKAWKTQPKDLLEQAEKAARAVKSLVQAPGVEENLSAATFQEAAEALLATYDHEHGGFGDAPKFPQPCNLLFLLRMLEHNRSDPLAQKLVHTLDRMARGGMYDQIGGGFHRYATDARWLVPHFEKMLYDQGQLLEVYLCAHQLVQQGQLPVTGDTQGFATVARETCDYLLREMTDASGAFWSAQDAEVDAREGLSYLWSPSEIRVALEGSTLTNPVLRYYGLDQPANFQDPHDHEASPAWVVHQPVTLSQFAQEIGTTPQAWRKQMNAINHRLLAVRQTRKQPITDDKVLTSWNAMAIRGLALAGQILDEPRYVQAAVRACEAVLKHLQTSSGDLLRSMRQGQTRIPAFLEDYATLIGALTMLHQVTSEPRWLPEAERLLDRARRLFANDRGGCFDTLADQSDLFVRLRSTYDGAIPCGNSLMMHALLDLHACTGKERYLSLAIADLRFFSGLLARRGSSMLHMQHALLRALQADARRLAMMPTIPAEAGPSVSSGHDRPLHLRCEPAEVDLSDGKGSLVLHLKLDQDYHLHAHELTEPGLISTALLLLDDKDWTMHVEYPPAQIRQYPLADKPLPVYEEAVAIRLHLERRNPGATSPEPPRLRLRVQLCGEYECLPPATLPLPVKFVL